MSIRLVIADDHAIVREGLKRIVTEVPDLQVVGEAADGTQVMQRVRELDFDVLVLDLSMPGRSGMELIKQVKGAPSSPARPATSPRKAPRASSSTPCARSPPAAPT